MPFAGSPSADPEHPDESLPSRFLRRLAGGLYEPDTLKEKTAWQKFWPPW